MERIMMKAVHVAMFLLLVTFGCSYGYFYDEYFGIDSAYCQPRSMCVRNKIFPETNCYCDSMCNVLDDCCTNHVSTTTSTIKGEQFECVEFKDITDETGYGVHMVTKCSSDWADETTKQLCENKDHTDDMFLRIPVSDKSELKIIFKNMYCAQCSYIDNIYYWNVKIECVNGTEYCRVHFIDPQPEMENRICRLGVIDTCDDVTYAENCSKGQFNLMFDPLDNAYRNEYCAKCHKVTNELMCEPPLVDEWFPDFRIYTFRYLVDINAGTVEDTLTVTDTKCDSNTEVVDILTRECRKIVCAPTLRLVNRKCVQRSLDRPSDFSRSTADLKPDDRTINCTLIKLDPHEYELRNSTTLFILSQNKIYTESDFLTNGTDVFICSDHFLPCGDDCRKTFVRFDLDLVESYMSLVGTILSIVSLTITLIVYVVFPQLMNIPGKILVCLVISLAIAQLFFLIAPLADDIHYFCIVAAVLVHFCFLSAFCWMNVIAIDLWMTFSSGLMTGSSRSKRFMFYSLYAWLAPMVIVATALIVNFVDIDPDYDYIKPHYGHSICWITSKYGLLLYFVGPLAVFKIIDSISFIFTSVHIARAKREAAMASRKKNVCSLLINIKLSLLMGLTWVFAYIALVVDISIMWYLFIIFNSLQGLFIAICFLCTKKVYRLIHGKFEKRTVSITSKTQTTSVA